jgi:hypothetical protein
MQSLWGADTAQDVKSWTNEWNKRHSCQKPSSCFFSFGGGEWGAKLATHLHLRAISTLRKCHAGPSESKTWRLGIETTVLLLKKLQIFERYIDCIYINKKISILYTVWCGILGYDAVQCVWYLPKFRRNLCLNLQNTREYYTESHIFQKATCLRALFISVRTWNLNTNLIQ